MTTAVLPRELAIPRWHYALQLTGVVALTSAVVSIMSASDVVTGGAGPKLFLLLRMGALVLLCTWLLRKDGERWADLGLRRPSRIWMIPLALAGGFLLLIVLSSLITRLVLPAIGAQPPQLTAQQAIGGNLAEYLFWAIPVSWGSAAFGEELLLRGFIVDRIAKVTGSSGTLALLTAVVLQAVLFGSLHLYQGIGGALVTGMVGLVMGLVWLWSGRNLWPCILLHGLVNFITYTEFYTAVPGA